MATENSGKFRDELVQQTKDAGQELIRRADAMISPELDLIADLSIKIDFATCPTSAPDITSEVTVGNKTLIDRKGMKPV